MLANAMLAILANAITLTIMVIVWYGYWVATP